MGAGDGNALLILPHQRAQRLGSRDGRNTQFPGSHQFRVIVADSNGVYDQIGRFYVLGSVSEEDLRKIQRIYESVKNNEEESGKGEKIFREFLPVNNIYFSRNECTREEVIDRVCTDLESRGYTQKEFRSALLAREATGGTDTPYGGAIPHGAVKYVNQTALAIWISRKAVRWTNYKVNVAVFLALSEKDIRRSRQIINAVSELVMNKNNIQKLAASDSMDEVVREIYKGSLHD